MQKRRMLSLVFMAVLVVNLSAMLAWGDSFQVTLDTSPLTPGSTQTLGFILTNGDTLGNNNLLLGDFGFGTGNATGVPDFNGTAGITGDLTSGIAMTNTDGLELFTQQFTVGDSLSFVLTTTDNYSGPAPDGFQMLLCDAAVTSCYSDDSNSASMLLLPLNGGQIQLSDFTLYGANAQGLSAPVVTRYQPSTVPEPASLLLLGTGLLGTALVRRRRR